MTGGLGEAITRLATNLEEIGRQMQQKALPGSQEATDFQNIADATFNLVQELLWVKVMINFLNYLHLANFGAANTEATQLILYLSNTTNHSELSTVIIQLLRETLQQLKRKKEDEFNSNSRHQNLPELLDKLMEFDP